MKKRIKARYIIGNENGRNVIYKNGEMIYEDTEGTILEVGPKVYGEWQESEDLGNAVICPGFIDLDALGDIDHALIYGEQKTTKKFFWSEEYLKNGPVEAMTPEEEAFKSKYAYAQLISHGITTAMPITCVYYKKAAETYEEMAAAAENARELGLRAYLGPSFISSMHIYDRADKKEYILPLENGKAGMKGLKRAEEFALKYDHWGSDLIRAVMVPERIELQSEEVLLAAKKFAREHGLLMRLHAAQGQFEYNWIQEKHGLSSIQYLDSIGLLDENTLIPHAIYASGYSGIQDQTERDLEILRDRKTAVIHCPLVYSRSGQALESFGKYKRFGIRMCMGTDTFPPDPFENIRIGSAFSRHFDGEQPEDGYRSFFEAATMGGADALGRPDLGRLAPGCRADFIAVCLDSFSIGVVDDPLYTICMCASGKDVMHSVINGRTVLKDGKIPGLDYEQMEKDAQNYYNKLKQSFVDRSAFSAENFYDTSYPVKEG